MRQAKICHMALTMGIVFSISACSGVREQLGLEKQSPDEFRVVSRAPLSLPPDFALRPPQPGIPRPQEGTPTQQARQNVFRSNGASSLPQQPTVFGVSPGEAALLRQAGSSGSEPDIRTLVDRETQQINEENEEFINRLVFWRDEEQPGEVLDAEAEARRLQENAALGKSVGDGRTPTIQRRKKGLLEGIF